MFNYTVKYILLKYFEDYRLFYFISDISDIPKGVAY